MTDQRPINVMVAGIGGASLGTELLKSLLLAGRYEVFGCDISPTAYGLYEPGFSNTFLVQRENYVSSVIDCCRECGANWLIPGGEQPMMLLGEESERLAEEGITLVANAPEVISTFSDKGRTFDVLAAHGFHVPRTVKVQEAADVASVGLPCIVKPAIGSGGSAMVFFAVDIEEAMTYADYIHRAGDTPLAQEYVDPGEGEFTVGVLSLPDGRITGSIALRRSLDAKLSVLTRGRGGLVSSGYSQGHIGDYQAVRDCAESIAKAIGSRGALNIQGRVREGKFLPFEINPRLSASTYLRALAGFNEVDILLQYMAHGQIPGPIDIREGWYLRSLTESFVSQSQIKS